MAWENQNPEDKNLEAMRNQLSLENIMNADVLKEAPKSEELGDGQMRMVDLSGDLYLYTKHNGGMFRTKWSTV